jgi:hypothetical protein
MTSSETLRFDDLAPYLLRQNGNFLYKVPFRGGWAVLKIYYGSRGTVAAIRKSFGNVVIHGQTSYMPKTRCRIERECLELWAKHGFRTFRIYDGVAVEAPGVRPGGWLLLEYVAAPKLVGYLPDASIPLDERFATYRRFLLEWSRRHELAVTLSEPKLVHENGDGKHVMILADGFLWFDFEMVYRSRRRVREAISREIINYLWNLMKAMPRDLHERFLDETIAGYPERARLAGAYDFLYRNSNVLIRMGRAIDRALYKRARKPTSKYNVVRRLMERLPQS